MLLNIRGHIEHSTMLLVAASTAKRLDEVDITSRVFSKKQAREEFERFLGATDLPELTASEERKAEEAASNAQ